MKALELRAAELAAKAQLSKLEIIALAMDERFWGDVEIDQDRVRVTGRGLVKRWLSDSSLRFIADLAR